MRSQADLLYNEQNCFPGQNSVEKNCTFDQYTACGDRVLAVAYNHCLSEIRDIFRFQMAKGAIDKNAWHRSYY